MFLLFTIYLIVYCKKGVCQHFDTTSFVIHRRGNSYICVDSCKYVCELIQI